MCVGAIEQAVPKNEEQAHTVRQTPVHGWRLSSTERRSLLVSVSPS
jgi:hypothetical protein